ncbi:cell division protein PerM [Demequina soli]|uniref:cell division protein PerM n=1 Tax=Demequina soli TaxID=1638987 RepID=UPI000781622C|nr:DUF6350 family protein [Demequina soli]
MPAATPRQPRLDRLRAALPGWLGGALAGAQSAALSYLVVLAPALAAVAGAPSLDGSAAVDWPGAATVATAVWLLGHGVPVTFGGATVSLVPLGMPLVSFAILVALARRFASKTWTSWALGVTAFAAGAALIGWLGGPAGDRAPSATRAALVGAVIAAPAVATGIWRAHGARLQLLDRIPGEVRAGMRLGLGTLAGLVATAAALGGAWAVLGMDRIATIASSLHMDPLGAGALALGETLYVPTMVCWMVAWLVGPGFIVGTGSLYAPDVVTPDTLPAVPLLGALPTAAGGWWAWAPLVVVALAVLARAGLHRRIGSDWASARATGVAIAVVAVGLVTLMAVSSGSAGPGRLGEVGAEPVPVMLIGTALVGAGYGLVAGAVAGWRWARGRLRGDDAPVAPAPDVREPSAPAR